MTTLFNHRYRLLSELGRGGMSVVYCAHDTLLDRNVAVKLLSSPSLGTESRDRLMHEARAAARLNHPNIIQIYDAGEADGTAYIIMQLLDGVSLYQAKPSSLEEILAIARQICQALSHAHAQGVIHRDLKPENVILTASGAILTDFGLAHSQVSRLSVEGAIVGTVFYLSPEQALGQPVDGRTDLYALGALLYELACGRLPFEASDPLAVIAQHLYAPLVPPSTYNLAIPPELDHLIARLLNKRAEERPASADEVVSLLNALPYPLGGEKSPFPSTMETEDREASDLSPLDRLVRGRLVGRDRELAQARSLWKKAWNGESQVLLISGESGVGKTPLVRAILTLAKVSGGRALVGECFSGGSAPFAPIVQIIQSALEEKQISLPGAVMTDLLTLVPDMDDRFGDRNERGPGPFLDHSPAPSEQGHLFESVFALCAAMASQAPLLWVLEDVQWADRSTLFLMRHLARRSRSVGLRLLIILTYREAELNEAHELNNLLLDLQHERLVERIKLARFNREQTGELLAVMFQQDIPPEFLEAIYRETEGNLFFIEELCKALIEAGKLYRENGHWRSKSLHEIELPQSVRLAIQARVSRLPEPAQEVLRLAAIFGREFDFAALQQACDLDEDTLVNALDLAERAQLIAEVRSCLPGLGSTRRCRAGQVRFAFEHALIPASLRESITSLRRYRLHRRAASAIESINPDDHAALAYHYDQAGDEARARLHYQAAGDQAFSVYANQDAVHFYTEALSLYDPGDPARFEVLSARARIYDLLAQRQDQLADAHQMLEIAEELNDEVRRCDALIALADVYIHTDPNQARQPAGRAAAIARSLGDPLREGQALRRLGEEAWHSSNFPESRRILEEAARRFQAAGLPGEAASCLHMLSLVLGFQGLGEIAASQKAVEDALALSRQAGDRRQEATSLRRLAIVYMDQFRHVEALPYAQAALSLHQELGDRGEVERALNVLGLIMGWLGRDAEAEAFFRQSLEIAESYRSSDGITNAMTNLSWMYYAKRGEYEAGLRFLDDLVKRVSHFENPIIYSAVLSQKAELLSSLGLFARALALLNQVRLNIGDLLNPSQHSKLWSAIGLQHAELGDFPQAYQALKTAEMLAHQVGRSLEQASILSAWAWVDLLEGSQEHLQHGLDCIEQSIAQLSPTNWKFDLGLALRLAAELNLALGRTEPALARSEQAMRLVAGFPLPMERFDFVHSGALRAAGRDVEADLHLRRAYERVLLVAGKVQEPELRESWLTAVRANLAIVRAASARGLVSL